MDKRRKTHSANAASRNPTTSGARATLKTRAASSSSSISIGRPDSRTGAKSRQTFSGAPRGLGMSDPPKPQRATQKSRLSSKIASVSRTKTAASFIESMSRSAKLRNRRKRFISFFYSFKICFRIFKSRTNTMSWSVPDLYKLGFSD